MDHRLGRDHLGIEQGMAREGAMEGAAVPIRPVHHGRHTKNMCLIFNHFSCTLKD
jgi:hypothetical protein